MRRRDDGDREICQKPLLASSFENILAPLSHANVLSTLGSGCTSLSTLRFSGLKSTQIQTLPFFLGMTTMLAHQGVGCATLEITPAFSI